MRRNPKNEKELIHNSLLGDEKAFAALASPYRVRILHLCYGIIKDRELAEDLTQDAFLHAYAHLKDFRCESKFYTWLYKIAKNLSLNALKKKKAEKKRVKRIFDPERIKVTKRVMKSIGPTHAVEEDEMQEKLKEAAKKLPEKHGQVFILFVLEGKKHREIALQLGVPEGTVRSRLHYARLKIRTYL